MADNQDLDAFKNQITPFLHLWQSIVVRMGWAEIENQNRILILSVRFSTAKSSDLSTNPHAPQLENFKVSVEIFDISYFDQLMHELADGTVTIGGTTVRLERPDNNNMYWTPWGFAHYQFERSTRHNADRTQAPKIEIYSNEAIRSSRYDKLRDRELAEQWQALPYPFRDKRDVLKNYFEIDSALDWQDLMTLSVSALIPIRFGSDFRTDEALNHLSFSIIIPETADIKKLAIGYVEADPMGVAERGQISFDSIIWSNQDGYRTGSLKLALTAASVQVNLMLSYAGIYLSDRELRFHRRTGNVLTDLHRAIDPGDKRLLISLTSADDKKAEVFEKAVALLFGFFGFTTQIYGHFQTLEELAADLYVLSPGKNLIFGIECTIHVPNNNGKIPKLVTRCRMMADRLKQEFEVIPVVATPLSESMVPASDIRVAEEEQVALLTKERLIKILELANENKTAGDATELIRASIRRKKRNGPSIPFQLPH